MSRYDPDCKDYNKYDKHRCELCGMQCPPKPCPPKPCVCPCVGPTGPQGEIGPTGPQGEAGSVGQRGERGPMGPRGEKGSIGPRGEKGSIGPRGETGSIGPRGETGSIGPRGETGSIGPRGERGPIGPRGETGSIGPRGETGSIGPRGETGSIGPRGETGMSGPKGDCIRMLGSYENFEEFERDHPIGNIGDTYLVGGNLYTWNETTESWEDLGSLIGPAGSIGPQGDRGPIAATIPFCLAGSLYGQGAEISCDEQGKPGIIHFVGYGASDSYYNVHLEPGEWDSQTIIIGENTSYPSTFIMPYDGTIKNIHVLFANRSALYIDEGITLHPFACFAISDGTSLTFTVLTDTITYTEPYVGSADEIPKYSLRKGSLANLGISIPEGTLLGVVVGWIGEGMSSEQSANFSVSGGIFIE